VWLHQIRGDPPLGYQAQPAIDDVIRELSTIGVARRTRVIIGQDIGEPLHGDPGRLGLAVAKSLEHGHKLRKEDRPLLGRGQAIERAFVRLRLIEEVGRAGHLVHLVECAMRGRHDPRPNADCRVRAKHVVGRFQHNAKDVLVRIDVVAGKLKVIRKALRFDKEGVTPEAGVKAIRALGRDLRLAIKGYGRMVDNHLADGGRPAGHVKDS